MPASSPEQVLRATRGALFSPRVQMTIKAALAATLAWVAADLLVGDTNLEAYRYYAPLGAVLAVYPTVAGSLRSSVRIVAAIAVGGAVGLTVHALLEPGLLALAAVVTGGMLAAGLPFLGDSRGYVPVVALFVLVIGGTDPWDYTLAYVGLALLGALIAVGVGMLLPALRLSAGQQAVRAAQRVLADQLEHLADGLRQETRPGAEDWQSRRHDVTTAVRRMRAGVLEAVDARRANPRARFHTGEMERQRRVALALERVSLLVEDLTVTVTEVHRPDVASPLGGDVSDDVADALCRLAVLVRCADQRMAPDDERVTSGDEAVLRLTDVFAGRHDLEPGDLALLGAVVANLRRTLETVRPVRQSPAE